MLSTSIITTLLAAHLANASLSEHRLYATGQSTLRYTEENAVREARMDCRYNLVEECNGRFLSDSVVYNEPYWVSTTQDQWGSTLYKASGSCNATCVSTDY